MERSKTGTGHSPPAPANLQLLSSAQLERRWSYSIPCARQVRIAEWIPLRTGRLATVCMPGGSAQLDIARLLYLASGIVSAGTLLWRTELNFRFIWRNGAACLTWQQWRTANRQLNPSTYIRFFYLAFQKELTTVSGGETPPQIRHSCSRSSPVGVSFHQLEIGYLSPCRHNPMKCRTAGRL